MSAEQGNSFEKTGVVLFVLMMASNVINYLYQIIMGNCMSTEDFGTLNSLIALTTIVSVPSGAFLMISSRHAAESVALQRVGRIFPYVKKVLKLSIVLAATIVVVGAIFCVPISAALNIEGWYLVVIAMLAVATNTIYPVFSGVLQGMGKMVPYGLSTMVSMGSKLVVSLCLVVAGLGVAGGLLGVVVAPLCVMAFCGLFFREIVSCSDSEYQPPRMLSVAHSMSYIFFAQLTIAVISNIDVLLVKSLFSAELAGLYSSAMVIAKIPIYVAGVIVAILFPMTAAANANNQDTFSMLKKSLLYGGGIAVFCCALLTLFGGPLIGVLFGDRYSGAVEWLPVMSMLTIALTLLTILMNYLVALRESRVFSIGSLFGIVVALVIIFFVHDSVSMVVQVLCVALLASFVVELLYVGMKRQVK